MPTVCSAGSLVLAHHATVTSTPGEMIVPKEHQVSFHIVTLDSWVEACLCFYLQTVECEEGSEDDESLREMVELAAQRLYEALTPVH